MVLHYFLQLLLLLSPGLDGQGGVLLLDLFPPSLRLLVVPVIEVQAGGVGDINEVVIETFLLSSSV